MRGSILLGLVAASALGAPVAAAEFKTAADPATILYDAPSQKATPVFVVGRDYPLEVIVTIDRWLKVRDATGALAWVERRAVSDRRTLMVKIAVADVHSAPDAASSLVFRAEQGVLLEFVETAPASAVPGWVGVRHRDGQSGFTRVQNLWGV
jgi:SH3-like domain-containing protein